MNESERRKRALEHTCPRLTVTGLVEGVKREASGCSVTLELKFRMG